MNNLKAIYVIIIYIRSIRSMIYLYIIKTINEDKTDIIPYILYLNHKHIFNKTDPIFNSI